MRCGMAFRLGLVGLCTSHPESWVPIIRELAAEKLVDMEVVAAWDSGETRPAGFAEGFCKQFLIPYAVERLEEMLPLVDGVIVHTTNWDRHMEQAEPFVKAGKSVFIDKPVAGNQKDANLFLDWMKQGYRVTGGSVMRYCKEVTQFLAIPETERGRVYTAYSSIGVDDYNYGIHGYTMLAGIMGGGIQSVQYVGSSNQKQIVIEWSDGRIGLLTVGKTAWLPFHATVTTDKKVYQIAVDNMQVYRSMLERVMPYFSGKTDVPPVGMNEILEPEFAAMAARISWRDNGRKVFLTDLRHDDAGYDGTQFALEYRRARMG